MHLSLFIYISISLKLILTDFYSDIESECASVLADFDYLVDFLYNERCKAFQLDKSIFEPLRYWENGCIPLLLVQKQLNNNYTFPFRSVISGFGRCELVNGWILISHLRWKPQASWMSQIFPPIEPVPLEILRNDHDLLLQYIFK